MGCSPDDCFCCVDADNGPALCASEMTGADIAAFAMSAIDRSTCFMSAFLLSEARSSRPLEGENA
jgi:hypothetical protein